MAGHAPKLRRLARFLDVWIAPLNDLAIRIVLFRVFFYSGLTKIGDWNGTLFLFRAEYKVPILPYDIAAILATGIELGASTLVLVGLLARLAALPMLGMALMIQFVLGAANPSYDTIEHFMWIVLLLAIILRGPGRLSVDHLLARRFMRP